MTIIAQVTTYPYGVHARDPLTVLEDAGITVRLSPHGRKHSPEETAALLGDVDILIAGTEPLPSWVLEQGLPRLRHVARVGVGLDGLDIDFCRQHRIAVTYTPDAPARSVVEEFFGMLFSLSRHLVIAHEGMRSGQWRRLTGVLWQGKTLGIIGCGRIGKQIAVLARAFGMEVLAHDIQEDHVWAREHGVSYVSLEELLQRSLAVSLHVPADASTQDMINAERLAMMRRDAYLINTCRGEVVDEAALYEALRAKRIAGAALDVYRHEPYSGPLSGLDNVMLCCHQGSCSVDGRQAMEVGSAENAAAYLRGQTIEASRVVYLPE